MKKTGFSIIVIIVFAIMVFVLFGKDYIKKALAGRNKKGIKDKDVPNDEFPLRKGSVGKRVEQLQMFLVKRRGIDLDINGEFNEETEKAVVGTFTKPPMKALTSISEQMFKDLRMQDFATKKFE